MFCIDFTRVLECTSFCFTYSDPFVNVYFAQVSKKAFPFNVQRYMLQLPTSSIHKFIFKKRLKEITPLMAIDVIAFVFVQLGSFSFSRTTRVCLRPFLQRSLLCFAVSTDIRTWAYGFLQCQTLVLVGCGCGCKST